MIHRQIQGQNDQRVLAAYVLGEDIGNRACMQLVSMNSLIYIYVYVRGGRVPLWKTKDSWVLGVILLFL